MAALGHSAAGSPRISGLRLGVFVPLRFDGAGSNAEAQRRGDAERIWHGSGGVASFHRGADENLTGDFF